MSSDAKPAYIEDPTSVMYQLDKAVAPVKESLWHYPKEKDGWTHAHNAIRMELSVMKGLIAKLGDKLLAEWEVASMQAWWKGHYIHVIDHHKNEDEIFIPFMKSRVVLPEKLEEDHAWLVAQMELLSGLFKKLSCATELAGAWAEYDLKMRAHLLEEEAVCLPLLRAYFTPQETGKLVAQILGNAPKVAMGSFWYCMGGKREAMKFMAQEGIPFFVWYLQFAGQLAAYEKEMARHAVALSTGYQPQAASSLPKLSTLILGISLVVNVAVYLCASAGAADAACPPEAKCLLGLKR